MKYLATVSSRHDVERVTVEAKSPEAVIKAIQGMDAYVGEPLAVEVYEYKGCWTIGKAGVLQWNNLNEAMAASGLR